MRKLGATELKTVDVGGGLAVVDGSMTDFPHQELLGPRIHDDIVSTLGDISETPRRTPSENLQRVGSSSQHITRYGF